LRFLFQARGIKKGQDREGHKWIYVPGNHEEAFSRPGWGMAGIESADRKMICPRQDRQERKSLG
jgi:hypothetical protein